MLHLEGVGDLLDLPLDRALNVIYAVLMRNKDEKERSKMESELTKPLPGERVSAADPVWGDEAQGSAFLSALASTEGTDQ